MRTVAIWILSDIFLGLIIARFIRFELQEGGLSLALTHFNHLNSYKVMAQ